MKNVSILSLLLALTASASATNYYCAPSGKTSANGLSYDTPLDFATSIKKLAAGDTLFCLGGQYDFTATFSISTVGTAAKPVVIINYPGEKPIFDWRKQAYGSRGLNYSSSAKYNVLKGLTLRYTGKNAILCNGSYNTFEQLDVYGNGDTGVQMKGSGGHNLILNVDSHDNFDYKLSGITAADFGGNADGFADKQYTGEGNTYRGCRSWNNSDDGWDFYQRVTSGTNTVIENCICYANGPKEYDMRNHPRYEVDKSWFDQFQGDGIDITDNDGYPGHVSLEHYTNYGNANGFKLGGKNTVHDVTLIRCLAVGNNARGFDQNNDYGKMFLYNCTSYLNAYNWGFGNGNGGTLVVRNSVNYEGSINLACQSVTTSNNSWSDPDLDCKASDFQSLDTAQLLLPRLSDGSLQELTLLHLTAQSPLIDAGMDVGVAYLGKAPDLGCYEYNPSNIVPSDWTAGGSYTEIPDESGNQEGDSSSTTFMDSLVHTGSTLNIAYVTVPNNEADNAILKMLSRDQQISTYIFDASSTSNDYSKCNLMLISPVPSSGASGVKALKAYALPMLLLKPWMMKSSVWNWATAVNSSTNKLDVILPTHPIFANVAMTQNVLSCFTASSGEALTYVSEWVSTTSGQNTLATVNGQSAQPVIVDFPVGSKIANNTLKYPYLVMGFHEKNLANLSQEALLLIHNSCYYLLGKEYNPTGIEHCQQDKAQNPETFDLNGRLIHPSQGLQIRKGRLIFVH